MSIEKLKELLEVLKSTPYNEISYKEGDFELSLKRGAKETLVQNVVNIPEEVMEEKSSEAEYIKSPLVGAFYTASSPEAKPFVSIGDEVKKGQVIGIIEAMKLMNEIESPYDGVIESILVQNEQMVEYDEALFKIRVKE